jgi:glycosyltransferase involved in cell wall biosynthesis
LEVIIVIDGPDEETASRVRDLQSERVTILELATHAGGSEARNLGVRASRGQWIAFLDDDDEWLPEKLERQLSVAENINAPFSIVTSAVIVRQSDAEYIWPRQVPFEPLSEYLLARNSLYQGEGVLPIITWLVKRSLFEKVEFRSGLRKHQDWDWLLRAVSLPETKIEHVAEPLAIWHLDHGQTSVSRTQDCETSWAWLRSVRPYITPRAYAGFLATQVGAQAARQRMWRVFLPTLLEMFRIGDPKLIDVCLFLGMWFMPPKVRMTLRRRATRRPPQPMLKRSRTVRSQAKLLTIGVPVHNAMPYLRESMNSLLSQTDGDFQILAIDDGSSDGSLEYLRSIKDSRLSVISQEHRKLSSTLNRMLAESDTPWMVRHDADDVASPERISIIRQFVEQYPEAGMFYSNARYYQAGQSFGTFRSTKATPEKLRELTLDGHLLALCHPTVTLNVAKAVAVGGYRFDLHVEDIDLWWRMALNYNIHFIPECTLYFRHNATSVSTSNLEDQSINTLYTQYLLLSHLKGLEPLPFEEIRTQLSQMLDVSKLKFREDMRCANICMGSRQYLGCAKHALRALFASPKAFAKRFAYEFSPGQLVVAGEDPAVFHKAAGSLWPRQPIQPVLIDGATIDAVSKAS